MASSNSHQIRAFALFFCISAVYSSPILIDELAPSVIGVESRIANPASVAAAAAIPASFGAAANPVSVAAANPASGVASIGIDLSPSIFGVEVEDRIANPLAAPEGEEDPVNDGKSEADASSSSSSTFGEMISIDGIFDPDVTSVDVHDEARSNTDGKNDDDGKLDADRCHGSDCDCPVGFEGVQPFCQPIPVAGEGAISAGGHADYEDEVDEIPMSFYQKIAGVKNVGEFINLTKINVPVVQPFVTGGATPSLTALPAEGCLPKKKCVSVRPKNRHPAEDVFPSSIDVERCGGCCGHPELSCLPWSTEPVTVTLLKYGYNADGSISNLGFVTTSVIRELRCKCVKVQT